MKIIKIENTEYVSAKEIYNELGLKGDFSSWAKASIERAYLEDGKDFTFLKMKSTGGRPSIDYLFKENASIHIIIMSGGQFAKKLRDHVIELFKQARDGKMFSSEQIEALIDISKAMTLISLQKDAERKHYELYNQPKPWWDYRAALLGYSPETLTKAMAEVNKKYKSMRDSLIKLDSAELIRTGIVDLFLAMGKTEEFSINVGSLCKNIAIKMNLGRIIWDDTKPNPLGINMDSVNERKELFNGGIKQLKP